MLSQEYIINNSKYTHDYEAEAVASFEATGDDKMDLLLARFENSIEFDDSDDLGGLSVYFKDGKMVAFYDYENFRGSNELLSA